jgi:hypothetical protein
VKKVSVKQDQLRKAEIADALADLRLRSHPGEFYDEIRNWVVGNCQTPAAIRSLLDQLESTQPENFMTAIRSMKIPPAPVGRPQKFSEDDNVLLFAAFRQSAIGMERFARRVVSQDADDSAADSMHKRIKRLNRRYKAEAEFRGRVDQFVRLMDMLAAGT